MIIKLKKFKNLKNKLRIIFIIGNKVCIQISEFSSAKILDRYDTIQTTCNAAIKTDITRFYTSLLAHDTDRRSAFSSIIASVDSIKTNNVALNTKVTNLNTTVFNLKASLQGLIDKVLGSTNGIIAGLNCKFLNNNVKRIHDSICITLMVPLFQMSLCLAILSLAFFFNSLCAYILGMRSGKFKENNKTRDGIELAKPIN